MTPNKNEREFWWQSYLERLASACVHMDSTNAGAISLELIAESAKREREKVLEEVNTMINKHARKEAGNDLLVVPLGIAVLGLVSLQSKDGDKG